MPASAAYPLDVTSQERQSMVWLAGLVDAARRANGRLEIRDQAGAIVATVIAHDLPKRPQDMPRALRPKQKLSKRQRTAAKRSKLASPPPS
jgi:hypothetical protein